MNTYIEQSVCTVYFTTVFYLFKRHVYFPFLCVLFAPDEVEFQEDGELRLLCASRRSQDWSIVLDSTNNNACCVRLFFSLFYDTYLIYSHLFSFSAF